VVAKSLIKDVLFEETHDNAMNPKKDSTSAGGGTNQSGNTGGNTGGGSTPTPPAGEPDYDQPSGD